MELDQTNTDPNQGKRVLSLAVPFYNEEPGIERFFDRIIPVLEGLPVEFEIICVNDGSTDGTWDALCQKADHNQRVRAIDLSRNFGKEAALTAALDNCTGDAAIPMDADLQDPPEVIPQMVEKWLEGFEVVVARRKSRTTDSSGKRVMASWFYKVFNFLSETEIPENAGDFRLMDRKVLQAMGRMGEQNRFMKGLCAWGDSSAVHWNLMGNRGQQAFPNGRSGNCGISPWMAFSLSRSCP